jgi:hypothetical protein
VAGRSRSCVSRLGRSTVGLACDARCESAEVSREIEGLRWARLGDDSPWPKPQARGSKAAGLRFERSTFRWIKKDFPDALHAPWIQFEDSNGTGWASPDIVIPSRKILVEVKLSRIDSAIAQVERLYLPLVNVVWGEGPWSRVIVVKYWRGEAAPVITGFPEARSGQTAWMLKG